MIAAKQRPGTPITAATTAELFTRYIHRPIKSLPMYACILSEQSGALTGGLVTGGGVTKAQGGVWWAMETHQMMPAIMTIAATLPIPQRAGFRLIFQWFFQWIIHV